MLTKMDRYYIFKTIFLLVLVLWYTNHILCQSCTPLKEHFNSDHYRKRLFGCSYAVTMESNTSLHKCARACALNGWCKSFNYRHILRFCELNSVNASEAPSTHLKIDNDWDYFDIEIWLKLFAPSCAVNNTCSENQRCLKGGSNSECIKLEDTIPRNCPDDWYPLDGKCYFLSIDTWKDNDGNDNPCARLDANLTTVTNEETNAFLIEMYYGIEHVRYFTIKMKATVFKTFSDRDGNIMITHIYTPEQKTWVWLHDLGLDIVRRTSLWVSIETCTNATLVLAYRQDTVEDGAYRIDMYVPPSEVGTILNISKFDNGKWIQQKNGSFPTTTLHACKDDTVAFWMSWSDKTLRIGAGTYVGAGELENVTIQGDFTDTFSHLGVSRVNQNMYRFLYGDDGGATAMGTNGQCSELFGDIWENPRTSNCYRHTYFCEKPMV